jgi:3',5'-cyclic AMP phosphodiesterase CpdA
MRNVCRVIVAVTIASLMAQSGGAQGSTEVRPIAPPLHPLPAEDASAGITRFSFIAYGDTRGPHDDRELQQAHGWVVDAVLKTATSMASGPDPVRFVLQSGDAVQNGQDVRMLNVGFTPLIDRITTQAGLPYFFSAGNHDVSGSVDLTSPGRVTGLGNLFAANRNLIPPEGLPRRLNGYPTYAVAYGNTFVLAFDSDIARDSTQFNWVRAQLEGLDKRRYVNIIVFCHHPAYSSGPHGGSRVEDATRAIREMYMPLFRQQHVKLLLVGHEHLFEHYVERYDDATGTHRLDEIVSGGGGAPIYTYSGEPNLTDYQNAGAAQKLRVEHLIKPSPDTLRNPHHYLVVHVDGEKLRVEAFGVGWGAWFTPYGSAGLALVDARLKH